MSALPAPSRPVARHIPLASAILCCLIGAACLSLWHVQAGIEEGWLQDIRTVPHNTAGAFLLAGAALMALTFGARRLTLGLAGAVMVLALATLAAQLLGLAEPFEGLLAARYAGSAGPLPRWNMSIWAAAYFALAAGTLILGATRLHCIPAARLVKGLAIATAALGASLIGLSPSGFIAGDFAAHEPMAWLAPVGHLALALGLTSYAWRRVSPSMSAPIGWIGAVLVSGQFALTLLLWNGLDLLIEDRQKHHLRAETDALTHRFAEALHMRLTAVERMARRWELSGGTSERAWRDDAAAYVREIRGFVALQWASPDGIVQWIEPERGNEAVRGLDNRADGRRRALFERADLAAQAILGGPIDLVQGPRGLLLIRALRQQGRHNGYLVAVFRIDELLTLLSAELSSLNYGIEVTLDDQPIFGLGGTLPADRTSADSRDFTILSEGHWRVRIWPTDAALQRGPFSDLFLASGIAMSLLVAIAFWFWARNAEIARSLKFANRKLTSERNFVTGLISNTNALVVVLDHEGRIVTFNHASERLTGYAFESVRNRHFWEMLVPADQIERARRSFLGLIRSGEVGHFEADCLRKDGSVCRVAWSNTVSPEPQLQSRHMMCAGFDVTERQRTAKALLVAKQEADRANRAKSEFLSSMSHELRTPMNAVLGFAQLIDMDPDLPAEHRENVTHILKAGEHLLQLINDVLNLSRIESGRLPVHAEPLSCTAIIHECIQLVRVQAARRNICITLGRCPERPVLADRQLLRQVLLNLLSNAVKYNSHAGLVHVDASVTRDGLCRLSIADTGPGISLARQQGLFEPFNRLGAERGSIEGSGIGLVVSKRLAEAMGGTIEVVSEEGRGSTFAVVLPMFDSSRHDPSAQSSELSCASIIET